MKKNLGIVSLLSLFSFSDFAAADHHLVAFDTIVKLDDSSCAIELVLTGEDQNAFLTTDAITLDGTTLVTMQAAIDNGINDGDANNDAEDRILAASATFAAQDADGLVPDLAFGDEACAQFDQDAVFAFVVDGGATVTDQVNAANFSGFGSDLTAISREFDDEDLNFYDLRIASVVVFDNAENATVYGFVPTGSENVIDVEGGGCSLAARTTGKMQGLAALFLFPIFMGVLLFKRIQSVI